MRKGITAIVIIVCVVAGFAAGWLSTAFLPGLTRVTLVNQIKARGYIIVGTSSDWPPFEIHNITTGEYEGFDIDLSKMIAEELGVTVQWSDMDFDALVGACTAGTIDMIAAAMMVTAARGEVLAHSVPYIRVNEIVIVKGDSTIEITGLEDLSAYTVGTQLGTTEDYELEDLGIAHTNYPKADVLIADLVSGGIQVAFVDEPVFTVYAKIYDLKSIYTVPAEPTALWCRWEEPELMQVINQVILEAYKDGTLDALIAQWFE